MNEVFGDAFYYIAALNPRDRHHRDAVRLTQGLKRRVVTTVWVLVEVADALSSTLLRNDVFDALQSILSDSATIVLGEADAPFGKGLALYGARPDKSWSLTDCISFTVMQERGISEALTGDHHFVQAGFRALFQES